MSGPEFQARRHRATVVLATLVTLHGCSSLPPADGAVDGGPAAASTRAAPPPLTEFEQRQRERASVLARQGRLADAALAWEVLVTLRGDVPEYRENLARARRQIDVAVADRWQRAVQAQRRGDADQATQGYLAVLALQPDHNEAAEALRTLEAERNRRTHLAKPPRVIQAAKPATPRPAASPAAEATAASPTDRTELEHAVALVAQGEYDDAITLLERRIALRPDDAARSLLADAYFQKAEQLALRDPAAAVVALEKCLKLEKAHPAAAERLRQLKEASAAKGGPALLPSAAR